MLKSFLGCSSSDASMNSTEIRLSSTKGIDMQTKTVRNVALALGPAFFLFGSFILPSTAHAGFKWVEPPAPPAVEVAPQPQVITGTKPVKGDVQIIMAPESMAIKAPKASLAVAPKVMKPATDIVVGFADSVPLSVALRQILPRDTGFSVAQDVSLGTIVSWRGGAPWRDVLKTMLAPKELTIKEDGSIVHVIHQTVSQPAVAQPVMPKPAPMIAAQPLPASVMQSVAPASVAPAPVALAPAPQKKAAPIYVPRKQAIAQSLGYLPAATHAVPAQNHLAQTWVAHKGQSLRTVLMDWGRKANVDVSWQAEYDYPFQASISVMGTFEDVARKLLNGFQDANPKPVGYLYNNKAAGQRVLVIQTRGNNYAD